MSIASPTTTLSGDEEMTITASISGFTDGEPIFIKGAFFQDGSSNYFGYTKGENRWIKNSTPNRELRSVTVGSWDKTIVVKSDYSDSGFVGEGEYLFRVRFYYDDFTGAWSSNTLTITLNQPDPTPTQQPTPRPTSLPDPTSAPIPTQTQFPSPTVTKIPVFSPTELPITRSASDILGVEADNSIPGAINAVADDSTKSGLVSSYGSRQLVFALLFAGVGLALLASALSLKKTDVWKSLTEQKTHGSDHEN